MMQDNSGFSIILEDPSAQITSSTFTQDSTYRPRRHHTKSRNGCLPCKRRRIKCDETRPECNHCWQKGTYCHYSAAKISQPVTKAPVRVLKSYRDCYFTNPLRVALLLALEREHIPCDKFKHSVYKRSDAVDLLRHFVETRDRSWIASSRCQRVMQNHALHLAVDAPYLLHAVLGFSAAHLSFLCPKERKYDIAATIHYQRALQRYHEHLNNEPKESDADAMMACSILLSLLDFVHTTAAPGGESGAPAWVRSMQATQILSQCPSIHRGLSQGVWSDHVTLFDDWKSNILGYYLELSPRSSEDLEQVHILDNICAESSVERQKLYKATIFMLEYLVQLPPDMEVGNKFIYFIAILQKEFIELLDADDPLAMIIIGFWCALFSRVDQWWIRISAGRECRRISKLVANHNDPRLDGVVEYLASILV